MVAAETLERHIPDAGSDVPPDVNLVVSPAGVAEVVTDSTARRGQPLGEVLLDRHLVRFDQSAFGIGLLNLSKCGQRFLLGGEA